MFAVPETIMATCTPATPSEVIPVLIKPWRTGNVVVDLDRVRDENARQRANLERLQFSWKERNPLWPLW